MGRAEDLHAVDPPSFIGPLGSVLEVGRSALVLGSGQARTDIDEGAVRAAGIDVVRRRSGGGAVLLVPGDHVWIDLWVPAGHRQWSDDVIRGAERIGDLWVESLRAEGLGDLEVHRGRLQAGAWSSQVCFTGVGPGEVLHGGRKLVGVSQRRTRDWARFQCVVHRRFDAVTTFGLLADPEAAAGAGAWCDAVATIGVLDVVGALRLQLGAG